MTIPEDKLIELAKKAEFSTITQIDSVSILGFMDNLKAFTALVAAEATRWIPVSERLPDVNRDIEFIPKGKPIVQGFYSGAFFALDIDFTYAHNKVTHWRYIDLPEAS